MNQVEAFETLCIEDANIPFLAKLYFSRIRSQMTPPQQRYYDALFADTGSAPPTHSFVSSIPNPELFGYTQ